LILDEITKAVLSREEVSKYLEDSRHERGGATRARIQSYLEELSTTQRYSIYKALKHPLYPILRKIERIGEHVEYVKTAASARRSSPPASTCSAGRWACSTAMSPARCRFGATPRIRCT